MWDYLLTALLWSLIGFVLGYLTCFLVSRKKDDQ